MPMPLENIKVGQTITKADLAGLQSDAPVDAAPDVPVGATISAADMQKLSGMQEPEAAPDDRSTLSKVWQGANSPLVNLEQYYPDKPPAEYLDVEFMGQKATAKAPYQTKQLIWGIGRSVTDFLSGMTSPANIALTAAGGASIWSGAARRALPWVTGLFTAEMIANAPEQVKAAAVALKGEDEAEKAKAVTDLVLTSFFIATAGKHSAKGIKKSLRGKPQVEAQTAVDDLAKNFDDLDKLGKEQKPTETAPTEPSALSEVEKFDRAAAFEQQLSEAEAQNKSPQAATALRERLQPLDESAREQELHDQLARWEYETPELLKDRTPDELDALVRMDTQSPIAAELLRRKLRSAELKSNEVQAVIDAWNTEKKPAKARVTERGPASVSVNERGGLRKWLENNKVKLNHLREHGFEDKITLLRYGRKNGIGFDEAAASAISSGMIPENPSNMNPTDWLAKQIREMDKLSSGGDPYTEGLSDLGNSAMSAHKSAIADAQSRFGVIDPLSVPEERTGGDLASGDIIRVAGEVHRVDAVTDEGVSLTDTDRTVDVFDKVEVLGKAVSFGTNIKKAVSATVKALKELEGGDRLGLLPFSEENYRQAKPLLDTAWASYKAAGKDFNDFAKAMSDRLGADAGPYLLRYQPEIMSVAAAPSKDKPKEVPKDPADIVADDTLPYNAEEVADAVFFLRGDKEPNRFQRANKIRQIEKVMRGEDIGDAERTAEIRRAMDEVVNNDPEGRMPPESRLPEMDPNSIVVQRKTSDGLPAPAVTLGEFNSLKTLKEFPKAMLDRLWDKPIFMLERMSDIGDAGIKLFRDPFVEADYQAKKHLKDIVNTRENLVKLHRAGLTKSSGRRIGLYMISKRADGAETLRRMGKIAPVLTREEILMMDHIRTGYNTLFGQINEARKKAGLKPINYVEDYITFMRVFDEATRENGNAVIEDKNFFEKYIEPRMREFAPEDKPNAIESAVNYIVKPRSTPFRFGKNTVRSYRKVRTDAFVLYDNYARLATEHIHKGPVLSKMRELLRPFKNSQGKTVFHLETNMPRTARVLNRYLSFSAGIQPVGFLGPAVDKGFNRINNNLAAAMLSANLRSAAIQPTAILNSAIIIGKRHTAEGIADTFRSYGGSKPHGNIIAESRSLFMRDFTDAVEIAFKSAQREGGKLREGVNMIQDATAKLVKMGFGPLSWLDYQTAQASFYGAFRYATEKGMSREAARHFADEHVVKTQGSAAKHDLAAVQYQAMGRAATMFQNFVINDWNFIRHEVAGKDNVRVSNPEVFRRSINLIAGMSAIGILYEKVLPAIPIIGPVFAGGSPLPSPVTAIYDELSKGSGGVKAVTKAAKEMMELVPGPLSSLRYGTSPFGVTAQFAGDVAKVAAGTPGPKAMKSELVGMALGVPGTRQIAKTIRAKKRSKIKERRERTPEHIRKLRQKQAQRRKERNER